MGRGDSCFLSLVFLDLTLLSSFLEVFFEAMFLVLPFTNVLDFFNYFFFKQVIVLVIKLIPVTVSHLAEVFVFNVSHNSTIG